MGQRGLRELLPGLNRLQLQGKNGDVRGEAVSIRVQVDIQGALVRDDSGIEGCAALSIFAQAAQPVFNFLQGIEYGAAIVQRRRGGFRARQAHAGNQRAAVENGHRNTRSGGIELTCPVE